MYKVQVDKSLLTEPDNDIVSSLIYSIAAERAKKIEQKISDNTPNWWQWLVKHNFGWLAQRLLRIEVVSHRDLTWKVYKNGKLI